MHGDNFPKQCCALQAGKDAGNNTRFDIRHSTFDRHRAAGTRRFFRRGETVLAQSRSEQIRW